MFCLLHDVQHDELREAQVYNNYPRKAEASTNQAIIFRRIASGVPWFLRSPVALMRQVGRGSLETTGNRVLDFRSQMWDECRLYPQLTAL